MTLPAKSSSQAEELFRLLLDGVRDFAIFFLSPTGIVESWNPGAERIIGYRPEEAIGQHVSQFYSPEDNTLGKPELALGLAATDGRWEGHGWRVRKDGTRFWAAVTLTALRDDAGHVIGFAKVTRDVSEQKQLEEQLRQAQKMEAVGRLAGGVAHDFNNILTVISGFTELLLAKAPEGNPCASLAKEIMKATERAAGLTRQLLAFSRKQVVEPRVLDLNAVVADSANLLRRLVGDDIRLATALAPDLGRVSADADQIVQVVMNLAVNARDAMPQGGALTIRTANADLAVGAATAAFDLRPGRYATLAVSDSGVGMDEATLACIFEPFFSTKAPDKGTGLGLATVYGIVRQSGGGIRVTSEVGRGSTFTIYLPLVAAAAPSVRQPAPASDARGSETIALVEDEPVLRRMARLALEMRGYTVLEAADGAQALRLCARWRGVVDLLLTDVVMPGLSGRQVAEGLAAQRPRVKVLYMSGYTDDAVVRHGIVAAEAAFLQKPFTPTSLARKVREVLDR